MASENNVTIKSVVVVCILLLLAVGLVFSIGLFAKGQKEKTNLINPTFGPDDAQAAVIEQLEKFMELPTEMPQVEEITSLTIEKYKKEPIFARLEEGDTFLVYKNAGRVIWYRPKTKKVVDVLTLNPAPAQRQTIYTPIPSTGISVTVTPTTTVTEAVTPTP